MKTLLLVVGLLVLVGCTQIRSPEYYAALRLQKEEALKQEFREAYGADWQQKYLEYKLEIEKAKAANPPAMPNIVNVPARTRPMGSAELYKSYGHIQQTSPPSNTGNSTYWQEQQAQRELWDRWRREPSESSRRIRENTQTIVRPPNMSGYGP